MEKQNKVMEKLKAALSKKVGTAFDVEQILDINPIMMEVRLLDHGSKRRFCARLYHLDREHRPFLENSWEFAHADTEKSAIKLPQPSYGLKKVGHFQAHIAAYVPGMDLATYINLVGQCKPEFVVRLGLQLLKVAQYLDLNGIEHHQIKPANIIYTNDGKLILKNAALYGFESTLSRKLAVDHLDDIRYKAPEQISGGEPGTGSDIYQIGLVLYEMIAGRPAFEGSYEAVKEGHLNRPVANPQAYNQEVEIGLIHVLAKALAKQPTERFSSLSEFQQALELLLPAVERPNIMTASPSPVDDESRLIAQMNDARSRANQREYQGALRLLDAQLLVAGPRPDLVTLYRQIWQTMYADLIKQGFQDANAALSGNNPAQALKILHQIISVQSNHPQALELQGRIFARMQDYFVGSNAVLPLQTCLDAAFEVPLESATALMAQILILNEGRDPSGEIQSAKNMAMQQLSALYGGTVSNLPRRARAGESQGGIEAGDSKPGMNVPASAPRAVESVPRLPDPVEVPEDAFEESGFAEPDFEEEPALPETLEAAPPPASASPKKSSPTDEELGFDPDEDLLGIPDESLKPASATTGKPVKSGKKLPLIPILAAAAVVVVIGIVSLVVIMMGNSRKQEEATAAYNEAANLEKAGKWQEALVAWDQLAISYPEMNFPDGRAVERQKLLKYKIQDQATQIAEHLRKAELLMQDTTTPLWEMEESPVSHLTAILNLEPRNDKALGMVVTISNNLSTQANSLWEQGKVVEAKKAYQYLIAMDPNAADPDLEARIDQWIQEKVVGPQVGRFDDALKRKQWDKAREIGEELEQILPDPKILREKWDGAFAEYEEKYNKARNASSETGMLAALEVMAEIRPDDSRLVEEKDRLNRSLNLANILKLENQIKAATKKGDLTGACQAAQQLTRLESENQIAKDAIFAFRKANEDKIAELKNNNLRATLPIYDLLLNTLNWKTYRTEQAEVQSRVDRFDLQVNKLKKKPAASFAEARAEFDALLSANAAFAEDSQYKWLQGALRELVNENEAFKQFLEWETSVRDDVNQSFDAILQQINSRDFKLSFSRNKQAQLRDYYQDRIDNYRDNVIIMIRGADNLPKGRGAFSKKPKTYCRLESGGKKFETDVANGESPQWAYSCNFNPEPGAPLVFSVFHKKNDELIGSIKLDKLPRTGKEIRLKSRADNWTLIIDVKRAR